MHMQVFLFGCRSTGQISKVELGGCWGLILNPAWFAVFITHVSSSFAWSSPALKKLPPGQWSPASCCSCETGCCRRRIQVLIPWCRYPPGTCEPLCLFLQTSKVETPESSSAVLFGCVSDSWDASDKSGQHFASFLWGDLHLLSYAVEYIWGPAISPSCVAIILPVSSKLLFHYIFIKRNQRRLTFHQGGL